MCITFAKGHISFVRKVASLRSNRELFDLRIKCTADKWCRILCKTTCVQCLNGKVYFIFITDHYATDILLGFLCKSNHKIIACN